MIVNCLIELATVPPELVPAETVKTFVSSPFRATLVHPYALFSAFLVTFFPVVTAEKDFCGAFFRASRISEGEYEGPFTELTDASIDGF